MFNRFNLKKLSKEFSQFSDDVYLIVLLEMQNSALESSLKSQYTEEEIKLLSGQATNWMFGRDLTTGFDSFELKMQDNFKKIESQIKPRAIQILKGNDEYRTFAVCYLRMRNTIFGTLYGDGYLKNPDYNAANEVLDLFGSEFNETPTQNTFILLVKDFFAQRPGSLERAEQIRRVSQ
jgi:hypothetical protein